ncbi:MAG: chorismate lyase [Halothiobacillaceae bacterium]
MLAKHDERLVWLQSLGSLTKRLRRVCPGELYVEVLHEGWVRADFAVAQGLALRVGVWVWRREVVLRCDGLPYVHAQSFVGRAGLRRLGLRRLGQKPLGEVLFRRGSVCAGRGVVRRFAWHSTGKARRRWGVFRVHGHRVLLWEDFLSSLPPMRG